MIKYNLKCHKDHEFESWFSSSEEFEKLNGRNLLECIYCSSKKINKSIMAPMISSLKKKDYQFEILDKKLSKFLIEKASISINGVSLTISKTSNKSFEVNVIPHSLKLTNLKNLKVNNVVNVELDIFGKYMYKFLI